MSLLKYLVNLGYDISLCLGDILKSARYSKYQVKSLWNFGERVCTAIDPKTQIHFESILGDFALIIFSKVSKLSEITHLSIEGVLVSIQITNFIILDDVVIMVFDLF